MSKPGITRLCNLKLANKKRYKDGKDPYPIYRAEAPGKKRRRKPPKVKAVKDEEVRTFS